MRILFLGAQGQGSTSLHRADALRRLGHEVTQIDPESSIGNGLITLALNVRTGYRLFAHRVDRFLRRKIGHDRFDVCWVDAGAAIPPSFHRWVKGRGSRIVNYNIDDPFGHRDRRKWDLYRASVPYHDVTAVVREVNVSEARAFGAARPVRVFRSYDPIAHAPLEMDPCERGCSANAVVFVGTWMPERGPFFARLITLGVPVALFGNEWRRKAAEWSVLRTIWRGPAVYGDEYIRTIQCAKVAIGLLSKGNRDLHTTRSAEIPFIGGAVFCAERTSEHLEMYREDHEAVFWESPEECAARCLEVLPDAGRRHRMAAAARKRVIELKLSNDEVLESILDHLSR